MEKGPRTRRLVLGATPIICLLVLPLLYAEFFTLKVVVPFDHWVQHVSNWKVSLSTRNVDKSVENQEILRIRDVYKAVDRTVEEQESLGTKNVEKAIEEQDVPRTGKIHKLVDEPEHLSTRKVDKAVDKQKALKILLRRLVRGEDRAKLEATGFACDSALHSIVCIANRPVSIDTSTMTIQAQSNQTTPHVKTIVKPYARQEDEDLLKYVSPVQILHKNILTPAPCNYTHDVPAIIFSSSGFTGNQFHEFNEIIIPLFITSRIFQSQVRFILVDYKPSFVTKYTRILSHLSRFEVINPALNGTMHCFPGAVVGLKFHSNLALNSSDIPGGYNMSDFKQFLRESYNLKVKNVMSNIEKPLLVLISRQKTRMFLNENKMVSMMRKLGFRVVIARANKMSNLDKFAKLVSSCSVLVGVHGAGLADQVFLPNGAVMVQVVPLGLTWASDAYFGEPACEMGMHYLEYRIKPEESSLIELYGRDHPVIVDPASVFSKGYQAARAVYVDGQNMRINLSRFRKTLVEALRLLGRSYPIT